MQIDIPIKGISEPFFKLADLLVNTMIEIGDFFTQPADWFDDFLMALRPWWNGTFLQSSIEAIIDTNLPVGFIIFGAGLSVFLVLRLVKFVWDCIPVV